MLKFYTRRSQGEDFEEIPAPAHQAGVWAHASLADSVDVERIAEKFGLDENILRDVLDDSELPRIEYDRHNNLYFFLRVAWIGKHHAVQTLPLLAVVAGESFVTISKTDVFRPNILSEKRLRVRTSDSATLLLATIASVLENYESYVVKTSSTVKTIKGKLRSREASNADFIRFISINDNLNIYEYNLREMLGTLQHLLETTQIKLPVGDIEAAEDLVLYIKQLLASVHSISRSVESIQSAHATISNNILNQRMKALTVITLMVTIPNVFYGMYGMNVSLPYQNEPWTYAVMVSTTVFLMLLAFIVAKRTKLF
jgi:magnesium transporter